MWRSFADPKWKYQWHICQTLPHSSLSENPWKLKSMNPYWAISYIKKKACTKWPNFKTKPLFDVRVFLVTVSNQLWSKLYCCAAFEQIIPLATWLFVYRFYSSWVLDCDKSKLKPELHIACLVLLCALCIPHIRTFVLLIYCFLAWTYKTHRTNKFQQKIWKWNFRVGNQPLYKITQSYG